MISPAIILGYIGAFLISIAFLPQTIKTIKEKQTKNLSLLCYSIYHLGLILFIIYASFDIENKLPLLLANAFGAVVNTVLLTLIIYNLLQKRKTNNKNNKSHSTTTT